MFFPFREFSFFGLFFDPATVALVVTALVYFLLRTVLNRMMDLNRYVWHRPLVDISLMVIFYCVVILTLKPI
jgi:hypothetical protein